MRSNQRRSLLEFTTPANLLHSDVAEELNILRLTQGSAKIKASIYKGEYTQNGHKKYAVRKRLRALYYDKCAYCEDKEFSPEVEHYRPKKRVSEAPNHTGYYWLCYEWTNLLPSCRYCNTSGGKGNKFPISGTRVLVPPIKDNKLDTQANQLNAVNLVAEKPILLHPEVDDLESGDYFAFNYRGEIIGQDMEGRGAATIEICNLNRENLLWRRRTELIEPLVKTLRLLIIAKEREAYSDVVIRGILDLVFEEFLEKSKPSEPFSLFALYIQNNFTNIIANNAGKTPEQRAFLGEAFKQFLDNNSVQEV